MLAAACLAVMMIPSGVSRLGGRPVRVETYPTAGCRPGIYAECILPATGGDADGCAIVWCDANDGESIVRGARLGRLAWTRSSCAARKRISRSRA
jgi:hypothetical protein